MGATDCLTINTITFSVSDCINIISILVNSVIAIWIVYTIQNKLNNKRVLKDFFIEEIKDIRSQYKSYLSDLVSGKIQPKTITSWHKLMSIKINDIMLDLQTTYKCDKDFLRPYQIDLRELITENIDFIEQFNKKSLQLSSESINQILKFQQNNNKLFSDLIIKINNK